MVLTKAGKESTNLHQNVSPLALVSRLPLAERQKRIRFQVVDSALGKNLAEAFCLGERKIFQCQPLASTPKDFESVLKGPERPMKQAIWISYDLGVRGDYEGMYAWLDEHGALECGDSLALVHDEFTGQPISALQQDLQRAVEVTRKTRMYVIWRDAPTGKMKGRFIFGNRKAAPWTGYAVGEEEVLEDVEI